MSYYDILLAKNLSGGGGGGDITVESLSVTENGTYTAPSGKAYTPVVANVPNSYAASDEGKVVSSGALVAQTSQTIDTNGTYDTTLKNQVVVNVSGGGGLEYESGVYQLSENVASGFIPFSNTHENPPDIVCVMIDLSDSSMLNEGLMGGYAYTNMKKIVNGYKRNSSLYAYGFATYVMRQTGKTYVTCSTPTIDYATGDSGEAYRGFWVDNSGVKLPPKTNYQWNAGSYKWFAAWLPTA